MAFIFYYSETPIFWTHNSEDKPTEIFLNTQVNFQFLSKCPVSFIDNFTIKTVLPKNLKPTLLLIEDNDPSVPITQKKKYYLLNKTSKIMQGGYEYEGILDAWLTYGLPLINEVTKGNNRGKYYVKVNRFLSNRIFRTYLLNRSFLNKDELFDYSKEEYGFFGEQISYSGNYRQNVNPTDYRWKVLVTENDILKMTDVTAIKDEYYKITNDTTNHTLIENPRGYFFRTSRQTSGENQNITCKIYVYRFDVDTGFARAGDYYCFVHPIKAKNTTTNWFKFYVDFIPSTNDFQTKTTASVVGLGVNSVYPFSDCVWSDKLVGVFYYPLWKFSPRMYFNYRTQTEYNMFFILRPDEFYDFEKAYQKRRLTHYGETSFNPTEVFRYPSQSTNSGFGRISTPEQDGDKQYRIDYGTRYNLLDNEPPIPSGKKLIINKGYSTITSKTQGEYPHEYSFPYWMTKISREPIAINIPNAYVASRAQVAGVYLNPTFPKLLNYGSNTTPPYTRYQNAFRYGIGYNGFYTFNGTNFSVFTPWDNAHTFMYDFMGTSNNYVSGFAGWLQSSKESMNTQLVIANDKSQLAHKQAVLDGTVGGAKTVLGGIGKFISGDIAGGLSSVVGLAGNIGSSLLAQERASQIYSHAKLSQQASIADKRNSSKGTEIRGNYADDDFKNKLLENVATYNFNKNSVIPSIIYDPTNTETSASVINPNYQAFKVAFAYNTMYDYINSNLPLSHEAVNFFNRLSWNVGMKGDFYMDLHLVLKPDYSTIYTEWRGPAVAVASSYLPDSFELVDNPFVYLNLDITDDVYRNLFPHATLEEIGAIQGMFSSGVRIWKRRPEYTNEDDFTIMNVLWDTYNKLSGIDNSDEPDNYNVTNTNYNPIEYEPDDTNNYIQTQERLKNNAKTKKRSKRK